jgi:hypothetical protein
MAIGPVEYAVIAFPGNNFKGEIVPELGKLVDKGIIKILDLAFVTKDADGNVAALEIDDTEAPVMQAFSALSGKSGGLLNADDMEDVANALEPNSSAALLVWEDTWLADAAAAFRRADAVVLERRSVPYDIVEAAAAWAEENAAATSA